MAAGTTAGGAWGGGGAGDQEHATFGMARFRAEEVWHTFLNTNAEFGTQFADRGTRTRMDRGRWLSFPLGLWCGAAESSPSASRCVRWVSLGGCPRAPNMMTTKWLRSLNYRGSLRSLSWPWDTDVVPIPAPRPLWYPLPPHPLWYPLPPPPPVVSPAPRLVVSPPLWYPPPVLSPPLWYPLPPLWYPPPCGIPPPVVSPAPPLVVSPPPCGIPPPCDPLPQVDPGLVTLSWCGGLNCSCHREQTGKEGLGSRTGLRLLKVALQTAPTGGPWSLEVAQLLSSTHHLLLSSAS